MNSITNLIKNNNLNCEQRDILNKVLYLSYEKMAIKQANNFKKFHSFKCKNICRDELILSSKIGLFKSTKKYNGNSSFIYFSQIYIRSELLKTLTTHYSLSPLPKSIRIKNKKNYSDDKMVEYKKNLDIKLIDYSNNWQFDKIYNKNKYNEIEILNEYELIENINELWVKINKLDPFIKRIFHLRFDYEFNIIRSNKNIGELMCCSEENVRKNLVNSIKQMANI
jgi:RNA polymerase sigma factor (sigma-70 family)